MRRSFGLMAVLACFVSDDGAAQCETAKIFHPFPYHRTQLGAYIDVDGATAVVSGGGPGGSPGVSGTAAFVFEKTGLHWTPTDVLATPLQTQGVPNSPVVIDGSTVMIGRPDMAGVVFVFERSGTSWIRAQTLTAANVLPDSAFARRIALDGDHAVIAAPTDPLYAYRGGAVFTFERIGGVWIETGRLDPPAPQTFGFFGLGLALEGDTLLIGEPGLVTSNSGPDRVYAYRYSNGSWSLEQRIDPETSGPGFGYTIALEGDVAVIGAVNEVTWDVPLLGAAYVYERSDGEWHETARLTAPPAAGARNWAAEPFGASVDLQGDRLMVGGASPELLHGDQLWLFRREPTGWALEAELGPHDSGEGVPGSPLYGAAVRLAGDSLLVGSPGDVRPGGPDSTGALYTYTLARLTEPYCGPATANSTGGRAVLRNDGCPTLVQNNLELIASRVPPHQPALLLVGRTAGFVPFAGGSDGNLCLAGPLGLVPGSTSAAGEVSFPVDLFALPIDGGFWSASAGETWRFQVWFHEPGPSTGNFTDALAVPIR